MTNIYFDNSLKNKTTFNFGNCRHIVEENTKILPSLQGRNWQKISGGGSKIFLNIDTKHF